MRRIVSVLAFAGLVGLALAPAAGAQQDGRTTRYIVKGILLLPGEAYIEEADAFFDIDMSFGVGGAVDTKLGEKFWGGVFLDLLNVSAYDESEMMFEAGVALKAALGGLNGKPLWRPGIGFGYGSLSGGAAIDATTYFTIRAGVEAVMPSGWLAEAMLYGAPTGGNDDVTVTYGPMLQLRFGRVF
ncbi:MAG: hypothetical protein ACREME_09145 [Gemmatimonadales bacterium]